MIGIYKITNLINDKSYIGQSVNIKKRFNAHKSAAFNPNNKNYNFPLYKAIRKYGIENFKFEVLEECEKTELNDKEVQYISQYQTHSKKGYNQDDGGDQASHYTKLSNELVSDIILRLKTSLDSSDYIGEEFGVTGRTIRNINSGDYCRRESEIYPIRPMLSKLTNDDSLSNSYKIKTHCCKICGIEIVTDDANYCVECGHKMQRRICDRPDPITLAKMVKDNGFNETGRRFGVSGNTIKKWCKFYNIPHLFNELVMWYDNQVDSSCFSKQTIQN